jgi:hypothetical protein
MADTEEMVPATGMRVEANAEEEINRRIRRELEARVYYYAQRPEEIDARLDELDREWDIERLLETSAGALAILGLTLGSIHRRWALLSALGGAFLLQHGVQGWCPPVPVFRRLGIRTAAEICHERFALKALRGDFDNVSRDGEQSAEDRARRAIEAADLYA